MAIVKAPARHTLRIRFALTHSGEFVRDVAADNLSDARLILARRLIVRPDSIRVLSAHDSRGVRIA